MVLGITIDPTNGDVIAPDYGANIVCRITARGRKDNFAGGGIESTVDGVAVHAQFTGPSHAAVDIFGTAYVPELTGHTVRRITAGAAVTTLAGSGVEGYVNGVRAAAEFSAPACAAILGTSTLYVTDHSGQRIRSIDIASGVAGLVAGTGKKGFTDGALALFRLPRGIAVQPSGVVWIGDQDNYAVRKWDTGIVATVAGTGALGDADGVGVMAGLGRTRSVALDGSGFLWIGDQSNEKVKMLDTATGVVTTMYVGYKSLYGVAVDPSSTRLYTADWRNVSAYGTYPFVTRAPSAPVMPPATWVAGTGAYGDVEGIATMAQFGGAFDLSVDPTTADVLVADYYTNRASRLSSSIGSLSWFAGDGTLGTADGTGVAAQFTRPTGVTVDPQGITYVGEHAGNVVRKITVGAAVTTLAGSGVFGYAEGTGAAAQFSTPANVAAFGTATVYVVDHAGHRLRSVAAATGATALVAGNGTRGFTDGVLATVSGPRGLAVDGSGVVFFGDQSNFAVRKWFAGSVTTLAGTGVMGDFDGVGVNAVIGKARSMSLDTRRGYLWFGDESNGAIKMMDTATGLVTTMLRGFVAIWGIAVDPVTGRVYASEQGAWKNVSAYLPPTMTGTRHPSASPSTLSTSQPPPLSKSSTTTARASSASPSRTVTSSAAKSYSAGLLTSASLTDLAAATASSAPTATARLATAAPSMRLSAASTTSNTASIAATLRAAASPSATISASRQQPPTVSGTVLGSATISASPQRLTVSASVVPSRSRSVPSLKPVLAELEPIAEAVSQTVSVAAIVAMNPAVAGMVARTTAIVDTLLCRAAIDRVPDFAVSPTRAEIEMTGNDAPVRYHIGGLVANAALLLATALYNYCFDTVLGAMHRSTDVSWRAIVTPHVPSVFVVPSVFFAQPLVSAAVTVVVFASGSIGGVVCAVAVVLMCLAASIACTARLFCGQFPAEFRPLGDSKSGTPRAGNGNANTGGCGLLALFFGTDGEWTDLPRDATSDSTSLEMLLDGIDRRAAGNNNPVSIGFVASYDKLFTEYNSRGRWFILVEFTACQYLGVITGLLPFVGCALLQILTLVGVALFALSMLVVRPYATLFDNALLIAATLCQLVAAVLAVFSSGDGAQTMVAFGGFIVLVQLGGSFTVWAVRLIYRKRHAKQKRDDDSDDDQGSDVDTLASSMSIDSDLFLLAADANAAEAPRGTGGHEQGGGGDDALDIAELDHVAVDVTGALTEHLVNASPAADLAVDAGVSPEMPPVGARLLGLDAIDILQLGAGRVYPTL
jgi:hypothetical protein